MEKVQKEMRRHKRVSKRCEIEFASEGQTCRGLCRNVCPDGLFIKTRKPVVPNALIEMTIHLPDGSTSKLRGRITRVIREPHSLILERAGMPSKDGIGVQLTDRDENYQKIFQTTQGEGI